MSQEARYTRVGAFVLAGIGAAIAAALWIGGGALGPKPLVIETVFDESVQGIEVGSPVKLRGVKIGSVAWIGFVDDVYTLEDSPNPIVEGNRVLVRMNIDPRGDLERTREQLGEDLRKQIEKGLRLRLTPLGITGTSFVQADYMDPENNPPLEISYTPEHLYVPSAPSTIAQLSSAAERLMARIDTLDVESLLTNFDTLLVNLNKAVGSADVEGVGRSVGDLVADLRETSNAMRRAIEAADTRSLNRDARRALDQVTRALGGIEAAVGASGDDLAATLDNLRVASENLREVSETARAYPSLLFFGAPPPPPALEESK